MMYGIFFLFSIQVLYIPDLEVVNFWIFSSLYFWCGFCVGISNMQEIPYSRIFKGINHLHAYFQIHSLLSYFVVVLIPHSIHKTAPPTGKFHVVMHI